MNYTVLWQPSAEQELADIWSNAPDREAVADAADMADERLRRDPYAVGESRAGAKRVAFFGPLVIDFEVRDTARTVLVLRIRRSRRPR
jgi:mRNA-degrading endonuclease RelE of RelBE toxin-antitoxin system